MAGNATWRPHDTHGKLSDAKERSLPDSAFAFPTKRIGPLTGAAHVRELLARFASLTDVSDEERDLAFENIRRAAHHYHVDIQGTDWRQLGTRPPKPGYSRKVR